MIVNTGMSTEIINKICEFYNAGVGATTIVKTLQLKNPTQVYMVLKKCNIPIKRRGSYTKYHFNENFFENIDDKSKAYWVGFIAADGCVDEKRNSLLIGLSQKDRMQLQLFKTSINSTHPIFDRFAKYSNSSSSFTPKSGCNFSHITLISTKMTKDLVRLGLTSRKTFKLTVPNIPNHLLPHFWRGLFDGDGYCYLQKKRGKRNPVNMYFETGISCNEHIADSFLEFLADNNIVGKKIKDKSIFCVRLINRNACKLLELLYTDADNLYLPRKYEKYDEYRTFTQQRDLNTLPKSIQLTKSNTYKVFSTFCNKKTKTYKYIGTFKTLEEAITQQSVYDAALIKAM